MSGRHKFDDLVANLPMERRQGIAKRTQELLAVMPAAQTEEENDPTPVARVHRQPRDMYRYHYQVGNKIVYSGITNNPARSEVELQRAHPGGRIVRQGPRVTRGSAERWAQQQKTRQYQATRASTGH